MHITISRMKIRIRFDDTRHLSLNGGYKGGQLSLSMPKWHNLFEKWTHLPDVPYASENARILCAKRKIVRLRMIFHSAENDFACCCKRFYAVCQLHHPYNEIERKKGSHPSYKLWFNPLRWTFFLTAFTCPSRRCKRLRMSAQKP